MVVNKPARRLALAAWGVVLMAMCASAWAQPTHYPSPDEAIQALLVAVKAEGTEALKAVLGPEVEELGSGDAVADQAARASFAARLAQGYKVRLQGDDRAELLLEPDDWPFSIPLVKQAEGWYFDTAAGMEELASRRIGRNELHTIATARAYVDAQHEYAAQDPAGDGVHQYARHFGSTEGKHDGLYWPSAEGEPESPLGPLVAEAVKEGYGRSEAGQPQPYHGYYYRILEAQGPHAPGGAMNYLDGERMTGGFGLVAYPAVYGKSGIMTFIVDARGLMFQKDLGEDTASLAAAITGYDPDSSWAPVTEE